VISFRPIYRNININDPQGRFEAGFGNVPTAVNLLLTCRIMITVIINAEMWAKDAAPWKMIVLANSIFRA
jgi:hypothetical protein